MTALTYALQLLAALPPMIQAGIEVKAFIEEGRARVQRMQDEGRDPTDEEWNALNAEIEALTRKLNSDEV